MPKTILSYKEVMSDPKNMMGDKFRPDHDYSLVPTARTSEWSREGFIAVRDIEVHGQGDERFTLMQRNKAQDGWHFNIKDYLGKDYNPALTYCLSSPPYVNDRMLEGYTVVRDKVPGPRGETLVILGRKETQDEAR